jgi:hypothetical protein
MTETVTVALLGDPDHPFETYDASIPAGELERPWADRRKVDLNVEEDEKLVDVLGRAAAEFGVQGSRNMPPSA